MTVKHNCVCGTPVKRSKGKYYHNASGARRSGRIKPWFGSYTQLCSDCMSEFIRSRPNHDSPSEGGTHVLCDFCNDSLDSGFLKRFFQPTITRWVGKVPNWKGSKQTVCMDCRDTLDDFIEEKKMELEEAKSEAENGSMS